MAGGYSERESDGPSPSFSERPMTTSDEQFADSFGPSGAIGLEGSGQLRQREALPLLLKVIFLVDLIVCLIRAPILLFTLGAQVVGMLHGDWQSPAWLVALLSGAGIIVFGGSGDLMMLSGRR